MAEKERQTKAERREAKRLKRLEEEKAAKAAAAKARNRNVATAITLVVVLSGLFYLALGNANRDDLIVDGETITFTRAQVADAQAAAGCEVIETTELASREHLTPADAPPANALYPAERPTASGPHYEVAGPIYVGVLDDPLDERSTTHNMEHGSVVVWFDPDGLESGVRDEIDEWVIKVNEAGFEDPLGRGAGVLGSAYTDPGISSGKSIAFRAWNVAMDCDSFDETVANAFLLDNFGERGLAPERFLGEFPEGVFAYTDEESTEDDTSTDDASTEDGSTEDGSTEEEDDAATDDGSTTEDDTSTEDAPEDEPTEADS